MSINSLTNKGIVLYSPSEGAEDKTIIVVGVARGGTSIISGVLHHLGVYMGKANEPVYEDVRLSLAFEKQSKEKFESIIEEYNQQHNIWAWKRPSTLHSLSKIARKVRNPHFVFVFRDMLSVANRNTISMHKDIGWGLQSALDDYRKIVKFINKSKHPALLVSSEKVVKHKDDFINSISEFSGITSTQEQKVAAQEFLSPNPTEYLEATRLTRAKGKVDERLLKSGLLKGWACYAVNHGEVQVEVIVNGELLKTISANQFDERCKKPGIHPTGQCGFKLDLKELGITPSDDIQVKVKGDVVNLHKEKLLAEEQIDWLTREELDSFVEPKGGLNRNLLQTGIVRGWARTDSFDNPAKVGIYVNSELLAVVPASIQREHLCSPDIHPTGHCGFDFNAKLHGVLPSDSIEVKVENAKVNLHAKPLTFPALKEWLTHQELQQKNQKAKNEAG